MTNQPPLNPDASDSQVSEYQRVEVIETPARDYPSHGSVTIRLYHSERQSTAIQIAERTAESLRDQLNDLVAVAQPVVNSAEELDKLPSETVVIDALGFPYRRGHSFGTGHIGNWEGIEYGELLEADTIEYPARVMHLPESS